MRHDDQRDQQLMDAVYEGREAAPDVAEEAARLKAFRADVQRRLARPAPGLRRAVLAEARRRTERERAPWFTWALVPAMAAAAFVLVWLGVHGALQPPAERQATVAAMAEAPPRSLPEKTVAPVAASGVRVDDEPAGDFKAVGQPAAPRDAVATLPPVAQPAQPAGTETDRLVAVREKDEQAARKGDASPVATRARQAAGPAVASGKVALPAAGGGGGLLGQGRFGAGVVLGAKAAALEKKTLEALESGGAAGGDVVAAGTAGTASTVVLADEAARAQDQASADADLSEAEARGVESAQVTQGGVKKKAAPAAAAPVLAEAPAQPLAGPAPVFCAPQEKAFAEAKGEAARVDAAVVWANCLRDAGHLEQARSVLTDLLGEDSLTAAARQRLARELLHLSPTRP